jgi:transcriptional regulator with XRE-family HTH domain
MKSENFGEYIRRLREEKNLPLRKVAAQLDIDTSTLSKVERGDRPISIEYLKPLSEILLVDLKEIQIRFIADTVHKDFGQLEFVSEGLKEAEKQIKKNKK